MVKGLRKNNDEKADAYDKWSKLCLKIIENSDIVFPIVNNNDGYLTIEKFLTVDDLSSNPINKTKNDKKLEKNIELIKSTSELFSIEELVILCNISKCGDLLARDSEIGSLFQYIIANNVKVRKENKDYTFEFEDEAKINDYLQIEEVMNILKNNMEYFDFEKILLTAAYNSKIFLEENDFDENVDYSFVIRAIKNADELLLNRKCKIKGIDYVDMYEKKQKNFEYSSKELHNDAQRIIGDKYYSKNSLYKIQKQLLNGEDNLNQYPIDLIYLLELNNRDIKKLSSLNLSNFKYCLDNDLIKDNEIKNIFNQGFSGTEYDLSVINNLYEKNIVTRQDILNSFMKENINFETILEFSKNNSMESEVTIDSLIEYYDKIKENPDNVKDFNRYALLFRNIKLKNKDQKEQKEIENSIVEKLYEKENRNYEKDLTDLYQLNLLSIETVIDWGDAKLIYDLMSQNALKSKDAKLLLDQGNLDIGKVKKILIKSNFSDSEKVNFIYTTFDGNEKNQREARDELMQTLNGKIGLKTKSKSSLDPNPLPGLEPNPISKKGKKLVVDPMLRWTFIKALDKDYTNKMYSRDTGVFILPNVNNGMVIVEKLFKKTSEGMAFNYGTATFVMSLEEYYKNKSNIIVDERVNDTELTKLYSKGIIDKFSHSKNWSYTLLKKLNIDLEKLPKEEKEIIEKLAERIKEERELIE